ncbi:hypothetical protein NQ317_016857 [Molorchus minor]|uniref:Uncharacterized protein n=1 Tax=Molorchus minor TaxID=1323400 RepID=A0ABQ9JIZ3_9CUCU|nr:hypothetical protein NQ317_016857 [Molorchus minor]
MNEEIRWQCSYVLELSKFGGGTTYDFDLQKQLACQKERGIDPDVVSEEPVTGKVTGRYYVWVRERPAFVYNVLALYELLSIYTRPIMKTFH